MNDAKPTVTLTDVLNFIYGNASKEDRAAISQALNSCRSDDILSARMEFKVGDKVFFEPRKRGFPRRVYGVITQKNRVTFHVRPEGGYGREWKVTASAVKKDDRPAS